MGVVRAQFDLRDKLSNETAIVAKVVEFRGLVSITTVDRLVGIDTCDVSEALHTDHTFIVIFFSKPMANFDGALWDSGLTVLVSVPFVYIASFTHNETQLYSSDRICSTSHIPERLATLRT